MAILTTNPADVLAERIRRQFIPFLRNELKFADFATPGAQEGGQGSKSLRWIVMQKITADETGGLSEGSATDGEVTTISVTTVSTTMAEYGAWAKRSSLAEIASTPETRQQYAEVFGEHGARTNDSLLRNVADDTTTFLVAQETATGTGTLATTDTAIAQDIAIISGRFNQNDCKGFTDQQGMYVVIVHGEVEQDLVTDVTTTRLSWSEINKHVPGIDGQKKIIQGSPGAVYGTMVLRSNNISTAVLTNTVTAYKNIALSRDAIGRASWTGMTPDGVAKGSKGPQIITKTPGPNDTSNPLNMFVTLGWKSSSGQVLIESSRAIVYYSAV